MMTRIPLKIISLYSRVNDLLDAIAGKMAVPTLSLVPAGEPFPEKAAQKLSFVQITAITAQKLAFFVNTEILIVITHWMENERELQSLQSLCNHAKAQGTLVITIPIFPKGTKITFLDHPLRRLLWHHADLIIPVEESNSLQEVETIIHFFQEIMPSLQAHSNSSSELVWSLLRAANLGCLGILIPKTLLENPSMFTRMLSNLARVGFVRDAFDLKQLLIFVQQDSENEFHEYKQLHNEIARANPLIPLRWYLLLSPTHASKKLSHVLILIFKELKGFKTRNSGIKRTKSLPTHHVTNKSRQRTPMSSPPTKTSDISIISRSNRPMNFLHPRSSTRHPNPNHDSQLIQSLKQFSNILESDPSREPIKEIEVYVFDEGGITLGHFGKGTIRSCNDPTLITGLFSAIQTFAHDVIGGKPRYIETDKLKCVFDVRSFTTSSPSGNGHKRTITGVALYPTRMNNQIVVRHLNYCLDMVQDLLSRGISESECAEVVHQLIESGGLTSAIFPTNQNRR